MIEENMEIFAAGCGFLEKRQQLQSFIYSGCDEIEGWLYGLFLFLDNGDLISDFVTYAEEVLDDELMEELYVLIGQLEESKKKRS